MKVITSSTDLSKVTGGYEMLESYDLSVYELIPESKKNGLFSKRGKRNVKKKLLFNTPGIQEMDDKERNSLSLSLLEVDSNLRSFSTDNFLLSESGKSLATKDFRVIVKDLEGNIPEEVLFNCGSVALLMTSQLIDFPVGYEYIRNQMKKYGSAIFEYKYEGYLYIQLGSEVKEDFSSRTFMGKPQNNLGKPNP